MVAIINPLSCPNGFDAMKAEIASALEGLGRDCTFYETCESEAALEIAKRAIAEGADLLLAVGGDGTIMQVINSVIGAEIPVGIVPAGTGNLLATNLGIPLSVAEAVEVAVNGTAKRIDLVSVNGGEKYFAVMGGLGWDAEIMRETSREFKQQLGRFAYIWTAIKDIRHRRFRVRISLDDGKAIHAIVKTVLVANMGQIAAGVSLFPDADPTDGILGVGVLKASDMFGIFRLIYHTLRRKPQESPSFDAYTARSIRVVAHRPKPLELDGDDMGDSTGFTAEIVPQAATVMVPRM